ncbi:hypothetical protein AX15_003463 [Amanita polypyramis BW_CC]|nr:hypothetical protein AX15_003463 [Amanita polypyramis BW_CC]
MTGIYSISVRSTSPVTSSKASGDMARTQSWVILNFLSQGFVVDKGAHRGSTKVLVNRYESMSSDWTRPWESPTPRGPSTPYRIGCNAKDKEKSPIRQSIMSLFSVFKKNTQAGRKGISGVCSDPEFESEREGEQRHEVGPGPDFERNAIEIRVGHGHGPNDKALPSIPAVGAVCSQIQYLWVDGASSGDDRDNSAGTENGRGVTLFDAPVPTPISLAEDTLCDLAVPKKRQICGVLLYLSQYSSNLGSSDSPVWLPCTATLGAGDRSIVVSWSNPSSEEGQTSMHTVHLAGCTDIRSLVTSQLNEHDTKIPLMGCKEELKIADFKVFEILFEGRERERFAARTVRDRARWVSAIWDVILPSQAPEPQPSGGTRVEGCERSARSVVSDPGNFSQSAAGRPLLVVPSPTPERNTPSALSSGLRHNPPAQICDLRSPATPSIYPPTRSVSRLSASGSVSTTTPERCRSPSIMNLSQKSVVKQRLAQIKDMELQRTSSVSSICSTESASRRWGQNLQPDYLPEPSVGCVDQENSSGLDCPEVVYRISPKALVERIFTDNSPGMNPQVPKEPSRSSCDMSNLEPLLEVMKDHAHEHHERVTHLGDQLIGLQDEIQRLPKELNSIINGSRVDSTPNAIQQLMTKVDRKVETTADVLDVIEDKLTILANSCQQQASVGSARDKNAVEMLRAIDGIRSQLKSEFPAVLARLAQIQEAQGRGEKARNERPPLADRNKGLPPPVVDLSAVLSKLDAVIAMQRKAAAGKPTGRVASGRLDDAAGKQMKEELAKILALLEDNSQQRALHTQQQADNVRYLTELNTWLEAFVNHGTSQIENVAANVEQLCKVLGCSGQAGSDIDIARHSNLLQDLRELVANVQARQQSSAELQNSVSALLAAMKSTNLSELGSLANAIERQRQDQANLLKSLKAELSSEIKGERIRFVEAMREATTINVQAHVENLKQSLTTEVMKMSDEIGRLRQEKQAIESQMQDMLTFQDKHRISHGLAQAGAPYYHPNLEEYPTMTRHGQMTFPRR